MADEQTRWNNLFNLLTPPRIFSEGDCEFQTGMNDFEQEINDLANKKGINLLLAKGIEREPEREQVDIWGLFALGLPKNRDEIVSHKYIVGSHGDFSQKDNLFIVGCPTRIFENHKDIRHRLEECIGTLQLEGGGYYDFPSLKVYGKSEDFGPFRYSQEVGSLLYKFVFHARQCGRDEYYAQREQVKKTLALPEEERNQEILRRVQPWIGFLAGKKDQIPLVYKDNTPSPDLTLICFQGYDKYFNLLNMGYNLGLQCGFKGKGVDLEDSEITVKYTGTLSTDLKDSINRVATNDLTGQAIGGDPVYMSITLGRLNQLGLLTQEAEELAINKFPEALENFFKRREQYKGHRDLSFNVVTFLEELQGLKAFDEASDLLKRVIEKEQKIQELTSEEKDCYSQFLVR